MHKKDRRYNPRQTKDQEKNTDFKKSFGDSKCRNLSETGPAKTGCRFSNSKKQPVSCF